MGQSGLSYHMKILVDSSLVNFRVEGKWSHYSLSDEGAEAAKKVIDNLFDHSSNSNTLCSC